MCFGACKLGAVRVSAWPGIVVGGCAGEGRDAADQSLRVRISAGKDHVNGICMHARTATLWFGQAGACLRVVVPKASPEGEQEAFRFKAPGLTQSRPNVADVKHVKAPGRADKVNQLNSHNLATGKQYCQLTKWQEI